MIRVKKKLTLPEYRERKEVYELLGYKEVSLEEKGYKVIVTYEIDETDNHFIAYSHHFQHGYILYIHIERHYQHIFSSLLK